MFSTKFGGGLLGRKNHRFGHDFKMYDGDVNGRGLCGWIHLDPQNPGRYLGGERISKDTVVLYQLKAKVFLYL